MGIPDLVFALGDSAIMYFLWAINSMPTSIMVLDRIDSCCICMLFFNTYLCVLCILYENMCVYVCIKFYIFENYGM